MTGAYMIEKAIILAGKILAGILVFFLVFLTGEARPMVVVMRVLKVALLVALVYILISVIGLWVTIWEGAWLEPTPRMETAVCAVAIPNHI